MGPVQIIYYDIEGDDATSLRESMKRIGPIDLYQRRRDAYTRWSLEWTWPLQDASQPVLEYAQVDPEITVTLPRWIPSSEQHPLRIPWKRFIEAVVAHEREHVQQALLASKEMKQALRRVQRKDWTLKKAHAVARSIVSKLHHFDSEYDRKTASGAKQGIFLSDAPLP